MDLVGAIGNTLPAMFPVLQFTLIFGAVLAVGVSVIGIWSFGLRDTSARLWWRAYALGGVSPALTVISLGEAAVPFALSVAALMHAIATTLQGISLRCLREPQFLSRRVAFGITVASGLWLAGVTALWWAGLGEVTLVIFAMTCLFASAWATLESWRLHQQRSSTFSMQLLLLFALPAVGWLLRTVLVLKGQADRLASGEPVTAIIVMTIAACWLFRTISYFGMRFDDLRRFAEGEARAIRDQSQALARRNSEIASAMHAMPVCCIVTDAASRIIYVNAECRKVLGLEQPTARPGLDSVLIGTRGANLADLARLKFVFARTTDQRTLQMLAMTVRVTEDEGAATQHVLMLSPVECTPRTVDLALAAMIPDATSERFVIDVASGRAVAGHPPMNWIEQMFPAVLEGVREGRVSIAVPDAGRGRSGRVQITAFQGTPPGERWWFVEVRQDAGSQMFRR